VHFKDVCSVVTYLTNVPTGHAPCAPPILYIINFTEQQFTIITFSFCCNFTHVFLSQIGRKGRKGASESEDEPRRVYEVLKTLEGEMPDVSYVVYLCNDYTINSLPQTIDKFKYLGFEEKSFLTFGREIESFSQLITSNFFKYIQY
jgi:hypothetical protein